MKQFISVSALLVLIASPALMQTGAVPQADQDRAMLNTYCGTCHNTRVKTGGLALDAVGWDDAQVWERALRKLRGHQMPPPGSPQPPQKDVDSFVAWMENALDSAAGDSHAKGPKAGYVPIQRLNRTEYAASVKAFVGVDVNPKEVLPQDIQVEGFDNIADALSVSPAFLDQYVTAARHIAPARRGQSQSSGKNEGAATGTINRELEAIRHTFSLAIQGRKLYVRPHVPHLREDNVRTGFLTADEIERLASFLPKPLDTVVRFGFLTGWRLGECLRSE